MDSIERKTNAMTTAIKSVSILSSQIAISSSTVKGLKTYTIYGHEFAGLTEEADIFGKIERRVKIGVQWTIGVTKDIKKARNYVKQCKAAGDIVTLDLPVSARGLAA